MSVRGLITCFMLVLEAKAGDPLVIPKGPKSSPTSLSQRYLLGHVRQSYLLGSLVRQVTV